MNREERLTLYRRATKTIPWGETDVRYANWNSDKIVLTHKTRARVVSGRISAMAWRFSASYSLECEKETGEYPYGFNVDIDKWRITPLKGKELLVEVWLRPLIP